MKPKHDCKEVRTMSAKDPRKSWRYWNEPKYRIDHRTSCEISRALNGERSGKTIKKILGYSIKNLKNHLQKNFLPGMAWNNYGEWHVDHVIPKSFFSYATISDKNFKKCWALKNLMPLWAKDNIKKSNNLR